jgi:hypothetical protein
MRFVLQGLKELMEVYNEFMLADKGHHSLKAWKGEVIDQAIEVRESMQHGNKMVICCTVNKQRSLNLRLSSMFCIGSKIVHVGAEKIIAIY